MECPPAIVEIPVEWIRDDAPYLTMDRYTGTRPYTPPRELLRIWLDEFEQAHRRTAASFSSPCIPTSSATDLASSCSSSC